jgi:hypothetical protein
VQKLHWSNMSIADHHDQLFVEKGRSTTTPNQFMVIGCADIYFFGSLVSERFGNPDVPQVAPRY